MRANLVRHEAAQRRFIERWTGRGRAVPASTTASADVVLMVPGSRKAGRKPVSVYVEIKTHRPGKRPQHDQLSDDQRRLAEWAARHGFRYAVVEYEVGGDPLRIEHERIYLPFGGRP